MAIMLSLEEGSVNQAQVPDESGNEFNAYTLNGDHHELIVALLRMVEEGADGHSLPDEELLARLRTHIHRGVGTLAVRAKSPADVARLAVAA
jgi:DNA sulfur modification protein DndE